MVFGGAWITSGVYAVAKEANYAVLISNKAEVEQNNISDLASLLIIKHNTLVSYIDDIVERVKSGTKPLNATADSYKNMAKPLVLLHFSDVHGDVVETDRINNTYQKVVDLCDDVICTGDM